MNIDVITVREPQDGQSDSNLVQVRCFNTMCNRHSDGVIVGNPRLLGHYYPGSKGEVRCPRCGYVNNFEVGKDGRIIQTNKCKS